MKLAQLGDVMQLAFVPADIDAATRHWTEVMGAGPFFRLDHMSLPNCRYRGQPTAPEFSMRLGYFGDMQIELIEQHNGDASIYRDWTGGEALHHMCVLVDNIADVRTACAESGATVVQEADVPGGGAVIYAATGGVMMEYLQPAPGTAELFAMMRQAHRDWDGSAPLRTLG